MSMKVTASQLRQCLDALPNAKAHLRIPGHAYKLRVTLASFYPPIKPIVSRDSLPGLAAESAELTFYIDEKAQDWILENLDL